MQLQKISIFLISIFILFSLVPFASSAACGKNSCEPAENSCNCVEDCGKCEGDAYGSVCQEYSCKTGACEPQLKLNCCGNGICEGVESETGCIADCRARTLAIQILEPKPDTIFARGSIVTVKVRARTEFDVALDVTITAESKFGKIVLYDDGTHNDNVARDGIYANNFIIPANSTEDNYDLNVIATMRDLEAKDSLMFSVKPILNLDFTTDRAEYIVGDIIQITGSLFRNDFPITEPITFDVSLDGNSLHSEQVIPDESGNFSFSYHSSLIDPEGTWAITATASDSYSNIGDKVVKVAVIKSTQANYFRINFLSPLQGIFKRGEKFQLVLDIKSNSGSLDNADVFTTLPDGRTLKLEKITDTRFAANGFVNFDTPLGKQKILATAQKIVGNIRLSGSTTTDVKVEKANLQMDFTKPTKDIFELGDIIEFEVTPKYENGQAADNVELSLRINGENIPIKQIKPGVFYLAYNALESANGRLFVEVYANDAYSNSGSKTLTINLHGSTLNYWLMRRQGIILILLAILVIFLARLFPPILKRKSISYLNEKEQMVRTELRDLQKNYYRKGSLAEPDYNKIVDSFTIKLDSIAKQRKLINDLYNSYIRLFPEKQGLKKAEDAVDVKK